MSIIINGVEVNAGQSLPTTPERVRRKSGHTQPKSYCGSLHEPGRFRVSNWLHLLNISHSAFYARLRYFHKYPVPPPDGHDPRPYWHTTTVLEYIQK